MGTRQIPRERSAMPDSSTCSKKIRIVLFRTRLSTGYANGSRQRLHQANAIRPNSNSRWLTNFFRHLASVSGSLTIEVCRFGFAGACLSWRPLEPGLNHMDRDAQNAELSPLSGQLAIQLVNGLAVDFAVGESLLECQQALLGRRQIDWLGANLEILQTFHRGKRS